ncbi:MAG TPA: hypothetical protein VF950_09405 [Planctomycetota bacterium]
MASKKKAKKPLAKKAMKKTQGGAQGVFYLRNANVPATSADQLPLEQVSMNYSKLET